jgi:hypothetical protein
MIVRLKAEIENIRVRRDAAVNSMQSAHNAELGRLRDQLADADGLWRVQLERMQAEHAEQIDDLRREMREMKERNDVTRSKLEREKNSLENELAKV